MYISTTDSIPGRRTTGLCGVAMGSTVRTKNVGKDIGASLKSLVGGELKSYSDMLVDARAQAMARMETQAAEMGADAIVNLRLTTSQVVGGAAELLAYGTAVTTEAE
ncbi:MAG TPA: YbjQ family protein [Acidimicrobiia bacterium]|nr:YbjQ family protein [Acidimicrobiia bacterium]HIL46209.1 YbjQ family protein [Acidimicrobiia bacterium]